MLIEYALAIHERGLVPLKGIWVDINGREYESKVTHLARTDIGYEIALEGLWGNSIVPIPHVSHFEDAHHLNGQKFEDGHVHYGTLSVVVDHFRDDPLEWLEEASVNLEELLSKAVTASPRMESQQ